MKQLIATMLNLFFLCSINSINAQEIAGIDENKVKEIVKSEISVQKDRKSIVGKSDLAEAETRLNKSINDALIKLQKNESTEKLIVEKINESRKRMIELSGDYSDRCHKLLSNILGSFELNDIQLDITALNSPTENTLGFSLKEVINTLVDKIIVNNMDKKGTDAGKVSGIINAIIDNPLTKIIGTAVPVINNVINFVSNLSIGNKRITPEHLKEFIKQISQYFQFYEQLAENNKSFRSNMNELKIKGEALKIILENFIIDRAKIFYEKKINTDEMEISKILSDFLSAPGVSARYKELVKDENGSKSPNIIYSIEALNMPSTTASQAQYLIDEIESLSNQYIKAYKKFVDEITNTLDIAKVLKKSDGTPQTDSKTIEAKKTELDGKFSKWEKAFKASLGIGAIKNNVSEMTRLVTY